MSAHVVVTFAEGTYEDLIMLADNENPRSFARGVSTGADYYGAGSCAAYVLPEDADQMLTDEEAGEVARVVADYEKRFGALQRQGAARGGSDGT